MRKLPKAILEAWEHDSHAKLGGLMQMAGIDPGDVFRSRNIIDHPWLDLRVWFPFPEVGEGTITHCLIHPRGKIMFDVTFENPVPPIHGYDKKWHVVLKDNPSYYQNIHRFYGHDLLKMGVKVVTKKK